MGELALWSVIIASLFERSGRSMAVAIAVHAGEHLDNVSRAPDMELRLRMLRFVVLGLVATGSAWSFRARRRRPAPAPAVAGATP
ncbi:MAG: hypothetical protein JOZ69_08255 [Myxococcales bacterium]|nr:hypothetical protein [Myxococcales bacterium]